MFNVGSLPAGAGRLWEVATVVTGGRRDVIISAGSDYLTITRDTILESILSDDPPDRRDVEAWVSATAQRLGFPDPELTMDGMDRHRGWISIRFPLDSFTLKIQGMWYEPEDSDEDPRVGGRTGAPSRHLALAPAEGQA